MLHKFSAMCKISSSIYCMKSAAGGSGDGVVPGTRWAPNTDVYLVEDGLVIMVELAGIRREDLELLVEGQRLVIRGQRPDCCRGPSCRFLMMEINYGHFESVIELPAGYDSAKARAAYQNGFLRVDVPHLAAAGTTAIPAKT
jgi:HSP20 family protein